MRETSFHTRMYWYKYVKQCGAMLSNLRPYASPYNEISPIYIRDKSILQPRTSQEVRFSTSNYETG